MSEVRKDGLIFLKAKNPLKKYDVFDKEGKKITSFGAIKPTGVPYEQYKDKIGMYSAYNHGDKERRELYYKRHNKNYGKYSADWFSKKYLW